MANGVSGEFAVIAVSISVVICVLILYRRLKTQPGPIPLVPPIRPAVENSSSTLSKGTEPAAVHESQAAEPQRPPTVPVQTESTNVQAKPAVNSPSTTAVTKVQGALMDKDRNERILADISENIRKSLELRPVTNHSTILYSDSRPRNTEYVRVKREIITPHGHIRFSILKDWLSTNMLAVFRRASLEWKTPDDLISIIPPYLEANAEVLENEMLLIGTSGHNEKLAIPIRNLDPAHLRECFDFVAGVRLVSNTPAVLLPIDAGFEVVSKGVITQTVFTNLTEQSHMEMKVLAENSSEALQEAYSAGVSRRG
jgi:hypothetical protein